MPIPHPNVRPPGPWPRRLRAATQGPGQCEVCRIWTRGALCGDCLARHAAQTPRCLRCALRLPQPGLCGHCLRTRPPFEHTVCVGDYAFPWNRIVASFKFEGRPELAAPLAERLLAALAVAGNPLPDLVLPVPLADERLRERGYNQAWELARRVAGRLGVPTRPDVLVRLFGGAHQADLPRADRLIALRGAFSVPAEARPLLAGRCVALVDDVMTTGATLSQAASALLRAGAASVDAWVVARTAEHGD